MNQYQKNNTYGELKAVVLGSFFTPEYFKYIKNSNVRNVLFQISDEINQDLDNFENFLKKRNVKVVRPSLPTVDDFYQYLETNQKFISSPLQVRDHHSVIGHQLYKIEPSELQVDQCLLEYNPSMTDLSVASEQFFKQSLKTNSDCQIDNIWYKRQKYQELAGPDWPSFYAYINKESAKIDAVRIEMQQFQHALRYDSVHALSGPNIIPTDLGIVIDSNEYCDYTSWAMEHIHDHYNYISIDTGSYHTDGCFSILGHKCIIGISPLIDYKKYFPDYTVIAVPDESYINHVNSFKKIKKVVNGKWWVPGQEHNNNFITFVEKYCQAWTGFVQETVFDVNVLAVDPDTVCVSGHNEEINNQLIAQGIEPVLIPWRHRFFVDGGLHCITLDLYRE